MDEQLANVKDNTTARSLKDLKLTILDCTKNIKSNDALFEISTFPIVQHKLNEVMTEYREISKKVEASRRAFLKMYESIDGVESADYIDLNGITAEYENNIQEELQKVIMEQDEDILVENRQMIKDPITRQNINFAVKSKVCKHIYDKETILNYFEQKKNKSVKCPQAGCTNKNMKIDDLIDDEETNKLIQSL